MGDFIAFCAAVLAALMIGFSDMHTDWTPPFLIVLGIIAVVCLGGLLVGLVDRRDARRHPTAKAPTGGKDG